MDKKIEKQIQEFERLERIAERIVTKNKVQWGDFILAMLAIIVSMSKRGYTQDTKEIKFALRDMLSRVLNNLDEYYDPEKKD